MFSVPAAAAGSAYVPFVGDLANGVEHQVDGIVYASGFEITTAFKRRVGFDIRGRGGRWHDDWADGYKPPPGSRVTFSRIGSTSARVTERAVGEHDRDV